MNWEHAIIITMCLPLYMYAARVGRNTNNHSAPVPFVEFLSCIHMAGFIAGGAVFVKAVVWVFGGEW